MHRVEKIMIALIILVIFIVGLGLYFSHIDKQQYKTQCVESGGVPIFNGSFFECLKK